LPAAGSRAGSSSSSAKLSKSDEFPRSVAVNGLGVTLTGNLGKGSFGIVFKGTLKEEAQAEVAVKEIMCKSTKERAQAEYEAKLMKQLMDGVDPLIESPMSRGIRKNSSPGRCACPTLFATDTLVAGPERWNVRIVMAKVPGVPLDDFSKITANRRGYADAMRLSRELLEQMCPTLERVSPLCVHRDINAHNILLEAAPLQAGGSTKGADEKETLFTPEPENIFTLIDFGLATDAKSWREGEWKTRDISGDCRYWPVSCWKQFLFGYKYVLANPEVADEYRFSLDAHSLALTCLQLLVEVSDKSPKPQHAEGIYKAWAEYWMEATRFHNELYAVFRGRGTWANLKKSFLQQQIAERYRINIDKLKVALERCAAARNGDEASFCLALTWMLSGRPVDWATLKVALETRPARAAANSDAAADASPTAAGSALATSGVAGAATDVKLGPSASEESKSPAKTTADVPREAPSTEALTTTSDVPSRPRRLTHRRQHTTDNSSSMTRQVPEVGATRLRFDDGALTPGASSATTVAENSPSAKADEAASAALPRRASKEDSPVDRSPPPVRFANGSHRRMHSAGAKFSGATLSWEALGEGPQVGHWMASPSAMPGLLLRKITEMDEGMLTSRSRINSDTSFSVDPPSTPSTRVRKDAAS